MSSNYDSYSIQNLFVQSAKRLTPKNISMGRKFTAFILLWSNMKNSSIRKITYSDFNNFIILNIHFKKGIHIITTGKSIEECMEKAYEKTYDIWKLDVSRTFPVKGMFSSFNTEHRKPELVAPLKKYSSSLKF